MFNYEGIILVNGNEKRFKEVRESKKLKNKIKKLVKKIKIKR